MSSPQRSEAGRRAPAETIGLAGERRAPPATRASSGASVWHLPKLAGLLTELALLLLIYYFKLENRAFFNLAALAFGGFIVHYFLPLPLRMPFFFLLSLAGAVMVFGTQAAWLVGIGLVLVGICHLPASFRLRVATL